MVDLTQYMWQHGEIPEKLVWTILVLTLKGNTNTLGIGLLETLWKVAKAIIETRLEACINLHDVIHASHVGRGMGKAIL